MSAGTSFTSIRSPKRKLTHAGSLREFESTTSSPIDVATSARMRSPSSSHGTTSAEPAGGMSTGAMSPPSIANGCRPCPRRASFATSRAHGSFTLGILEHRLEIVRGLLDVPRVPVGAAAQTVHLGRLQPLGELEGVRVVEPRQRDARVHDADVLIARRRLERAVARLARVFEVAGAVALLGAGRATFPRAATGSARSGPRRGRTPPRAPKRVRSIKNDKRIEFSVTPGRPGGSDRLGAPVFLSRGADSRSPSAGRDPSGPR